MKIKETEYDRCWMNPYKPKFLSGIQRELISFKEFDDSKLGKKRVYTWIVMMYDPGSPWLHEEKDYYNRKRETAMEAGFEIIGGSFEEDVEDVLLGKNEDVNKMVAAFISRFANPEYTQLINLLQLQHNVTTDVLKGNYDRGTVKTLDDLTNDINRLTNKLFGSGEYNEVLEAKKALYQEAEDRRIKLNPENIAKYKNENGNLPKDFNPYGDYDVDKMNYVSDEGEREPMQT